MTSLILRHRGISGLPRGAPAALHIYDSISHLYGAVKSFSEISLVEII